MTSMNSRRRLLGSAATVLGATLLVPQAAYAACNNVTTTTPLDTYACVSNTTTTDTSFPTNVPNDRNVNYSATIPIFLTVANGVVVDGFGLSMNNITVGTETLTVTNNGTIQVNTGLVPTAGGNDAALSLTAVNNPIVYSGTGSIINLGQGEGFEALITGTGTLNANFGGSVRADAGDAIRVNSTAATGGQIGVTTAAGQTVRSSGGDGIDIDTAGTGNVGVINAAAISSGGAGVNTLQDGINATSTGTGNITISNSGAIGTAADRAQLTGITAAIANPASAGTATVGGTAAIFSVGNAIDVSTPGTGSVSVIYGGALDTTAGDGVQADSTIGQIIVTTGGTINAANGDGIQATSTTGNQLLSANGAINAGATGISALSTDGNLTIANTAAITAAGIGIDAQSTGTGSVTVNRTGTGVLTSNSADAMQLDTTTGTITVTTGAIAAAGIGVDATSTTGNQSITVSGPITASGEGILATSTTGNILVAVNDDVTSTGADGISVDTTGTQTVNVASGAVVTAAPNFNAVALLGTGAASLTNSGTIGTVGEIAVYTGGSTPTTVTNLAGGTINGRFDLSNLNDTVTNSGTINATGSNQFLAGTDALNNLAGGTITLGTGSTIQGLETLTNAGTITGTGTLSFTDVATTLTNSGTLTLNGATVTGLGVVTNTGTLNTTGTTSIASTGTFTNSGTFTTGGATTLTGITAFDNTDILDLAAGPFTVAGAFTNSGTIIADAGATTITGQTSFANSGEIDLQDGAADDVLTINSDFVGTGGSSLFVDVADDVADELVITGAASGSTTIDANIVGSGILSADGVLVVDAGTSTAGAFTLGDVTGNASPLVDYALEQVGADYFLTASVNAAGFAPVPVGLVAQEMWYQSAEAIWEQNKLPNDGTAKPRYWGQMYFGSEESGGTDSATVAGIDYEIDNELETDRYGLQVGAEFPIGMGSVGITGGLERADTETSANFFDTRGWNIGAYGMFGGPVGFYGNVLVKHDRFDIDFGESLFGGVSPDGRSNGIDGEVGYRTGATGYTLDLSAGLSHVRTKLDDVEVGGLTYDYDSLRSTRGRLGARFTGSAPASPFFGIELNREFSGDGDVELSDGFDAYDIDVDNGGTWTRIEGGIGGPASKSALSISGWLDFGDVKGFGFRGGFRF